MTTQECQDLMNIYVDILEGAHKFERTHGRELNYLDVTLLVSPLYEYVNKQLRSHEGFPPG